VRLGLLEFLWVTIKHPLLLVTPTGIELEKGNSLNFAAMACSAIVTLGLFIIGVGTIVKNLKQRKATKPKEVN
jgi:hypothetical protein